MGMNRREFSDYYGIPYRTVQDWEAEKRELPDYLLMLTANALKGATEAVKVLVTEPHQKMNVEKFAKDHGKTPTSTEKDGYFEVVIE